MINKNPFKYCGHLDVNEDCTIYIERKEDLERVFAGINDLNYYAIVAPRQTGKTTFLRQLMNKITRDEFHTHECIYITFEDLSRVEKKEFYSNFARKIINCLRHKYAIQPQSILKMYEEVQSNLDLEDFLIELSRASFAPKGKGDEIVLNPQEKERRFKYVILIDEIDNMPDNVALEFIKTIRAIFTQKSFIDGYDVYSFVISGAVDLAKLTYGRTSPFNIAEIINLKDFSREDMVTMVERAFEGAGVDFYKGFPEDLFDMTNGHPCLSQKICNKIIESLVFADREFVKEEDLDREVDRLIDGVDTTLKTTLEKVKDNENQDILKRILKNEEIKFNPYDGFSYELELAGAIINDGGLCKVRNPIYDRFFTKQFEM